MTRTATTTTETTTSTETSRQHLADIRAEEAAAEEVTAAAARLRDAGREALGVTGTSEVRSLRSTFAATGVGIYPATALGLLVAVDQLGTQGLTVLGPEITSSLGIERGTYALVLLLKMVVVALVALPLAASVQRRPRRALVCVGTAFAWAVLTAMTGFAVSIWGLLVLALATGAATASTRSVHEPLLLDSYPAEARVRMMSFYRGFDRVGEIVGPLLVGACTVLLDLTWRGVFVAMGVTAFLAAVAGARLRDPGFGRWDTDKVREVVRADAHADDALDDEEVGLGFFEISRRIMLVPTIRRLLTAWAVVGMFLAPFYTYLSFFLQERWGMGPGARSMFSAVTPIFGIVALQIFGRRGEALFRRDPAQLLRLSGILMGAGVTGIALGLFTPLFLPMVVLFGSAIALLIVLQPAMALPMYSIVPSHMRAHLAALQAIFVFGIGGVAGLLLLGGIDRRFGTAGAILSIAVPGIISGFVLRSAARTINADLDRMLDTIVEEEEVRALSCKGVRLPMLTCRNVDFSYGQLQVLFGVNFTVDDGEMVALLGTNGAGKSTLLRVISGLGLPSRGSVRYRGADITYLEAERRVGLGISQVPGGKAVFGPMRVIDNLRVLGYTHGRNRKAVDDGIEASFNAFPRLAERRNQLASTLSGGEQQMLGLATAFIARPRLLLIDELSLGLAPIIVGELLEMVRQINAQGTSVVLVEQSVNVALSVVHHAYFMEKGEVRFDGVAADLLERPDLLRSVFLEGASKGLETAGATR
jgi:ABC-type branched-subunit amino acid transport system ATPase component/MFS family permease